MPPALPEDEDSIFAHYKSGINFNKYDDIPVDLSGDSPPDAVMVSRAGGFKAACVATTMGNDAAVMFLFQTFDEAKLCETLRRNITKSGYVKPTPVQKHGIPIIAAGRDLMACAQTGSGKTVSTARPGAGR